MRSVIDGQQLTVYFEGELNSYNAEGVEKELDAELARQTFSTLVLDFANLRYISSAGLRIILKLKQKYDDVHIIEASLEVYDVLSMTGFVNIMDVKKALKRIYVSESQVIGKGFFSTVYRLDKDTIVKVFNRVSDSEQIERELKLAKQAFVLGIPTAISFDIVRVNDKLGVCFEMLDCISLKDAFLSKDYDYGELIERYAKLLKKINTTECMDPSIRDMKQFYLDKVEVIKPNLEPAQYEKVKRLVETIPDTMAFVHGDCHFKNIMVQGDELLLIDMDTLAHGSFIFEFAGIRAPYIAFEEDDPGNSERFLGVSADLAQNIYHDLLAKYLGKHDQAIEDKIAIACYIHMMWWTMVNTPEDKKRLEGCKGRLLKLIEKYDDLIVG